MAKKVKEVIAIIEANGWHHVRTTGGHRIYKHPASPHTVAVAGKRSAPVPTGTLGQMRRDTGLKELR
jgi:predicted RNA binding protein YcfA (HicA-like mRNA interferase family)